MSRLGAKYRHPFFTSRHNGGGANVYPYSPTGGYAVSISRRYDDSAEDLRIVNGLATPNIVPGQALLIPLYTYTVQPGDMLTAIVRRAFTTLEQLRAANPHVPPTARSAQTGRIRRDDCCSGENE
ncbi:hypothetical protein HNR34_003309 [Geobacillus subterraneus]